MEERAASAQLINILTVIDTEYIKDKYKAGSKDPSKPTPIDHKSQFMIVTGQRDGYVEGQGTAELKFKANAGDIVSFRGTSIYQNSDDAVIVYDVKHWKGDQVFNQFRTDMVTLTGAVQPDPDGNANGLPPLQVKQNFLSLDSKVRNSGTEDFYVYIALYTLDSSSQKQTLYGYFSWDPQIQVP